MNQEAKEIWVRALRSGEYEQMKHHLANNSHTKHCCLGVLCEEYTKINEAFCYQESGYYLPDEVRDWAGLTFGNPQIASGCKTATYCNDMLNYSFSEIADLIERNL